MIVSADADPADVWADVARCADGAGVPSASAALLALAVVELAAAARGPVTVDVDRPTRTRAEVLVRGCPEYATVSLGLVDTHRLRPGSDGVEHLLSVAVPAPGGGPDVGWGPPDVGPDIADAEPRAADVGHGSPDVGSRAAGEGVRQALAAALHTIQAQNRRLAALNSEIDDLRVELDETSRGVVALHAELTEQAEELDRARADAEEAARTKAAFLADVGHEIRNPLNSVIGFAELLEETELSGEQTDFLQPIQSAGGHLRNLVDDLLDFSKLEAGQLVFERIPFDLVDCVEDALGVAAPQAAHKDLGLAAVFAPDTPVTVLGDPTRLRQILVNLLVNAVKFTAAGQVWVEVVTERVTPAAARLSFRVHDTGVGIAPDAIERIFAPFAQADASTTRRYGGTGLGLSIARELTQRMNGELTVVSTVGVGSTFSSTVQVDVDGPTLREEADQPLRGRRALIVHDAPVVADSIRAHLATWGADVTTVGTVRDAVGRLGPDVGLIVIGAHGEELSAAVATLQSQGVTVPTLLVAPLTMRRQLHDVESEVVAVLPTPVRRSALRAAIAAALDAATAR